MSRPPPEPPVEAQLVTTRTVGQRTDAGRGRIFPCQQCGADLTFNIGQQDLKCPYCGYQQQLELPPEAQIVERDFEAMLARIAERRARGQSETQETSEVRCESCGATVVFLGTLTSSECAYCGSPIQRENVHDAPQRVPVDGVLPFLIEREAAAESLRRWVRTRWFAPNDFLRRGVQGVFHGVYLPYWTFDALTFNRYRGQRGVSVTYTVGSGKDQRTVTRIDWYPVSGSFQRFFDDVLELAAVGLPRALTIALEPWPFERLVPFNQQVLAGFQARTYDIPLDQGFVQARSRIDEAIRAEVRQRIGGDQQRIDSLQTEYSAITYKHLLLPLWLMSYRYRDKPYQVAVNAATGEVQGERPYSWVKITLAVVAAAAVIGPLVYYFAQQ